MLGWSAFTPWANLTGAPSLSLPLHVTAVGPPGRRPADRGPAGATTPSWSPSPGRSSELRRSHIGTRRSGTPERGLRRRRRSSRAEVDAGGQGAHAVACDTMSCSARCRQRTEEPPVSQPVRRIVLLTALAGLVAAVRARRVWPSRSTSGCRSSRPRTGRRSAAGQGRLDHQGLHRHRPRARRRGRLLRRSSSTRRRCHRESHDWVARKDDSCRESDGCPDEEYLNARGIYTTTKTELTLEPAAAHRQR